MDMLDVLQQGTLLIVWTQQQIPSADARLQMYAWNEQLAMDSQIYQTSGWSTILSQALWNRWWVTDPPTELVHSVKSHSHSQHYQDHLEPTLHQPPYCWQKVPMSPDTITQWEDMREFSSNLLWPSLDQDNLMETNGESPLVWTMLHPPFVETRLQSFAWMGHLENSCLGVNPTKRAWSLDSHLSPMPCGTFNEAPLCKCNWKELIIHMVASDH